METSSFQATKANTGSKQARQIARKLESERRQAGFRCLSPSRIQDMCCELTAGGHAWPTALRVAMRGRRQQLSMRAQAPKNSADERL